MRWRDRERWAILAEEWRKQQESATSFTNLEA